jgi:hypothetical protein
MWVWPQPTRGIESPAVSVERMLNAVPYGAVAVLCLTLGLAPFSPPHLFSKLRMLLQGRVLRPIDWVDLVLHASPWLLLMAKAGVSLGNRAS